MKKSENGSKAKFLYSLLKVLKSISGELLIGICWSSRLLGVFMMKMCVVFSLTSFGNWKYECVMNFKEIFSFHPLINDCWMKLFILIISAIISSNDIFFSWIVLFNSVVDLFHVTWVFYENFGSLRCFRPAWWIVHQFQEVRLKIIFSFCSEFGVCIYVMFQPCFLIELGWTMDVF